jgi:hypothetical protein
MNCENNTYVEMTHSNLPHFLLVVVSTDVPVYEELSADLE